MRINLHEEIVGLVRAAAIGVVVLLGVVAVLIAAAVF